MSELKLIRERGDYEHVSVHSRWSVGVPIGIEFVPLFTFSLAHRRWQEKRVVAYDLKNNTYYEDNKQTTNPNRAVSVNMAWPGWRYDTSYSLGTIVRRLREIGLDPQPLLNAAIEAGWEPKHMREDE